MLKAIKRWFGGSSRGWGSPENPNYPIDYNYLGDTVSDAGGVRVTSRTALKIPAYWQGVTLLSGDVAKIPLEIYTRGSDRDRQIDANHPAYRLVRWQTNEQQSAFEFWRQMMVNVLIWNNAYALIDRDQSGQPMAMYPLLPDRTRCEVMNDRSIVYETIINGNKRYFDSFDIFHIKGISSCGCDGLAIQYFMRNAIGRITARDKFAAKFYDRGGRVGGVLQLPFSNEKGKRDKLEAGFRKTYEDVDAAFKTVVLRENAKFHQAQASFRDTQMLESKVEDVRDVARILNIPPHKLGDTSSSSYNSLEQENRSYSDSSLGPHMITIESECWLKLLDARMRSENTHFFEHTIGALLWADSKTVADIGTRAVLGGWMTPNEVRHWFNLNNIESGENLMIPSGMIPTGQNNEE